MADEDGNFEWAAPDGEVHNFINDVERRIGTYLYGRRMYDVMVAWESIELSDQPRFMQDYAAIWRAADKIVYSRSLEEVRSARTRVERSFDPEAVRQMKSVARGDLGVGGAEVAAQALNAGLVDEIHLFVAPVVVGGGKAALPRRLSLALELVEERAFSSGFVHLSYRVRM